MTDLFTIVAALYLALSGIAEPVPIRVTLTGYTCERVTDNPMHPCGAPRWADDREQAFEPGLACPPEWKDRELFFDGQWLPCDDTPYHSIIYGLPHVDARVETLIEAKAMSVQTATLYERPRMSRQHFREIVIALNQVHYLVQSETAFCAGCGDICPNPTDEQEIALFFNRHRFCKPDHRMNQEHWHEQQRR